MRTGWLFSGLYNFRAILRLTTAITNCPVCLFLMFLFGSHCPLTRWVPKLWARDSRGDMYVEGVFGKYALFGITYYVWNTRRGVSVRRRNFGGSSTEKVWETPGLKFNLFDLKIFTRAASLECQRFYCVFFYKLGQCFVQKPNWGFRLSHNDSGSPRDRPCLSCLLLATRRL